MKLRGTATNNLNDVIQMLQMARQSGMLTLQRAGKGNTVEQGMMMLKHGQIVDAGLGLIKGKDAFDKLSTWRVCNFVFQSSSPTLYPPLPEQTTTTKSERNGSTPFNGVADSKEAFNGVADSKETFNGVADSKETFNGLSPTSSVPYRLREVQEVLGYFDRLGLTRAHRHLFLLVNGKYSVAELMRLLGHRTDDFEHLLADLERVGFIHR